MAIILILKDVFDDPIAFSPQHRNAISLLIILNSLFLISKSALYFKVKVQKKIIEYP